MRVTLAIAAVAALVALSPGRTLHAQQAAPDNAPRISLGDFKNLVASKNVIVVDTRNADAFTLSRIPGAVLLPLEGLPDFPAQYAKTVEMLKAANKPIVTYCA